MTWPEIEPHAPGQLANTLLIDATLLNIQDYKVRIKGKVEQSKEWSSILPYTSV